MTYILGLTGSIATGKSTVSRYFIEKGIPVVDADQVARKVVEPGTDGLADVVQNFGTDILHSDGTLNREKLGALIFFDEEKRALLNRTLRQHIRKELKQETEDYVAQGHPLVVLDIPLLYEVGFEKQCDAVMVVYTTPALQLERLMARNNLSEQEASERIASQLSIEEKKDRADVVIDNNGSLAETYRQVDKWLKNKIN